MGSSRVDEGGPPFLEVGFLRERGFVGVVGGLFVGLVVEVGPVVVVVAVVVVGLDKEIPGGPRAGADRPGVPGEARLPNPGGPADREGEGDMA